MFMYLSWVKEKLKERTKRAGHVYIYNSRYSVYIYSTVTNIRVYILKSLATATG